MLAVDAAFAGDDDLLAATAGTDIRVVKETVSLDLSRKRGALRARLVDSDSTARGFVGRSITFHVGGKKVGAARTDRRGIAVLRWDGAPRKARFKAVFSGDDFLKRTSASSR
jgi:hypothetical protein